MNITIKSSHLALVIKNAYEQENYLRAEVEKSSTQQQRREYIERIWENVYVRENLTNALLKSKITVYPLYRGNYVYAFQLIDETGEFDEEEYTVETYN